MSNFDPTNRGVLFKNDRKTQDNHPDYKGSLNIDGVEYWQAAWLKKSKDGKTFMSFSYELKDEASAPRKEQSQQGVEPFGDEIPFRQRHHLS